MPPSPVVMPFFSSKEKQPMSPIVPSFPSVGCSPPAQCAQSSITLRPLARAIDMIASMSADWPPKCTTMIADVSGVTFRSRSSTLMQRVDSSTSTNTGSSPFISTHEADDTNVSAGTRTLLLLGNPRAPTARCSAAVPELTATESGTPIYLLHACSNSVTFGPRPSQALSKTSRIRRSSSSPTLGLNRRTSLECVIGSSGEGAWRLSPTRVIQEVAT